MKRRKGISESSGVESDLPQVIKYRARHHGEKKNTTRLTGHGQIKEGQIKKADLDEESEEGDKDEEIPEPDWLWVEKGVKKTKGFGLIWVEVKLCNFHDTTTEVGNQ